MQAETWKAIAHLPWMIKPLYGFVTDTFPIYGLRRQPYIVICGLTGEKRRTLDCHVFSPTVIFYC